MRDGVKREVLIRQVYISSPGVLELYSKLIDILRREHKSFNSWVYEMMQEYVRRHGEGNPIIPLSKWVDNPDMVAFPTLGEPVDIQRLVKMPDNILLELKSNAESYAVNADYVIRHRQAHQSHLRMGIRSPNCIFCQEVT